MARIGDAPPIVELEGAEEFIATGTSDSDVHVTADQIADFTIDSLTPAETLAKVSAASPQTNGLNANFLQGLAASYFQNASNLSSGTVPDARLPQGEHNSTWSSGGIYPNAGSLKSYLKFDEIIPGGPKIMLQWGWTNFVNPSTDVSVTFNQPFSGGWGNENTPVVFLTPECRGSEWSGALSSFAGAGANVEVTMSVYYTSLTFFKCSSFRMAGSGLDRVRGNWWAIGYYA